MNARREKLSQLLAEHSYLPLRELCERLGISEATARRDLAALALEKKVIRTYGGALSEFNQRFPSFHERCATNQAEKRKLARAAHALLEPGKTYFFDSGTTIHALAQELRERPVSPVDIVTPNLPAAELLATSPGIRVYLLGGRLYARQSILVGEHTARSLRAWSFHGGFFSAEAADARGIYNSRPEIIKLQLAAMEQCAENIFLCEASKINHRGPEFLASWKAMDAVITTMTFQSLARNGIAIERGKYLGASIASAAKFRQREIPSGNLPVHML